MSPAHIQSKILTYKDLFYFHSWTFAKIRFKLQGLSTHTLYLLCRHVGHNLSSDHTAIL